MKALKNTYKKKNFGIKYNFGVRLPNTGDVKNARILDQAAGNTLWFDAQTLEATNLQNLETCQIINE